MDKPISVVRDKVMAASKSGSSGVKSITLKNTSGPPMKIDMPAKNKPDRGVSIAALKDWMKRERITMAQMRRNGKFIRQQFGRGTIEKYAREALIKESHSMDEYFETQEFSFTETVRTDVRGKVRKEIREFQR